MRLRNVKNAKEIVEKSAYVVHDSTSHKGKFAEKVFFNNNPIHLEIGMGKGNFLIAMAKKYPHLNFVGVERYESVVCRALEKLEEEHLVNLKILVMDASSLGEVFASEIETIYLNFSDPWPKKRHAKRRLTSLAFLPIYDAICKEEKIIVQKTDNVSLFESSIVSLSMYGYKIEDISLSLADTDKPNCLTEYEAKFMEQGIKINYLYARKK